MKASSALADQAGLAQRLAFRASLRLWSLLLPALARGAPLPELLSRAAPAGRTPYRGLPVPFLLRRVKRACRRPWLMHDRPCLREGVLAWRFLRLAGHDPVLHFGIDRASVARERMAAHCWLSLNGETLLNPPAEGYVEIQRVEPGAYRRNG